MPAPFEWLQSLSALPTATSPHSAQHTAKAVAEHPAGSRFLQQPQSMPLLAAIAGNSPYLAGLIEKQADFFLNVMRTGIPTGAATLHGIWAAPVPAITAEDLKRQLRLQKQQVALLAAIADITGQWSLLTITRFLSDFADYATSAALEVLLRQALADETLLFPADNPENLRNSAGIFVLGMGKLGAQELNYSSDIDLIILYDNEKITCPRPDKKQERLIRLVRQMVAILEERTADGYVFRTDLRLRPDPSATPPILSVAAAETYYGSLALTWERAAYIKARVIAGDFRTGNAFLQHIQPFIWRRHLDFAAIADINAMKRQIHQHRGHESIRVAGHNIKIGSGGIREIEFFAQTHQLIWGGRNPSLRVPGTLSALEALVQARHVSENIAHALSESYVYLRTLEHRLQMREDEQTQEMPQDIATVATFMGYQDTAFFEQATLAHLQTVQEHYQPLFARTVHHGQGHSGDTRILATGLEEGGDTALRQHLEEKGYKDVAAAEAILTDWHSGKYTVVRTPRARQLLLELTPYILDALAVHGDPDAALLAFDRFLKKLHGGVVLFSMLRENRRMLARLADILGNAPSLAERLATEPSLIDHLLDSQTPVLPDNATLRQQLATALSVTSDYESTLRRLRTFILDTQFQAGLAVLEGESNTDAISDYLTTLADATLETLIPLAESEFASQHGLMPGGALVVLALGRQGSQEMGINSDLDLVFLYDCPDNAISDGRKPLPASAYYARLCQRIVSALTVPVGEGALYPVDMRLRPSGNAGPVAVHLDAFEHYQHHEAWTWEHQALTRARVVYGSPEHRQRTETIIRSVLTRPRDTATLLADTTTMHQKIIDAHPPRDIWHIKHCRGGLMDIELLTQTLQLQHAHQHPEVLQRHTARCLETLHDAGVFPEGRILATIHRRWRLLQHLLRLTLGSVSPEQAAPATLRDKLATIIGTPTFETAHSRLDQQTSEAWQVMERVLYQANGTKAHPV